MSKFIVHLLLRRVLFIIIIIFALSIFLHRDLDKSHFIAPEFTISLYSLLNVSDITSYYYKYLNTFTWCIGVETLKNYKINCFTCLFTLIGKTIYISRQNNILYSALSIG